MPSSIVARCELKQINQHPNKRAGLRIGPDKHTNQLRGYLRYTSTSVELIERVDTEWLLINKESTDHELKYDQ